MKAAYALKVYLNIFNAVGTAISKKDWVYNNKKKHILLN